MNTHRPFHLYMVDDDAALRDMLSSYLEKQGMIVTAMESAEDMFQSLYRLRPDLIVLDAGMPGVSGVQACHRIRAEGLRVPIILMTSQGDDTPAALSQEYPGYPDASADEHLGKPFSARELLGRVQAVLERSTLTPAALRDTRQVVSIGDFTFVIASRILQCGDEVRVLTTVEYALLAELTTNPRVAISRERLLAVSRTTKDAVMLRTIDAAIMRLRKIVEPSPSTPRYIQTVRGHGYMFVPQGGSAPTPAPTDMDKAASTGGHGAAVNGPGFQAD